MDHRADQLLLLLDNSDAATRLKAVQALGEIAGKANLRALDGLQIALRDPDPAVRIAAAECLGDLGGDRAAQALVEALADKNQDVWVAVTRALQHCGSEALPPLTNALASGNSTVRARAVYALGTLGNTAAVSALAAHLDDPDPRTRGLAARSVALLGATGYYDRLTALTTDPDPFVRTRAVEALGLQADRSAVPMLLRLLANARELPHVRAAAAEAVGKLGGQDAEQGLISALTDSTDAIRSAAADALGQMRAAGAVPELVAALNDPSPGIRWRAAVALGLIGDASALPALRIASVDPGIARAMRRRVSDAASQAIERIISNTG